MDGNLWHVGTKRPPKLELTSLHLHYAQHSVCFCFHEGHLQMLHLHLAESCCDHMWTWQIILWHQFLAKICCGSCMDVYQWDDACASLSERAQPPWPVPNWQKSDLIVNGPVVAGMALDSRPEERWGSRGPSHCSHRCVRRNSVGQVSLISCWTADVSSN